MGRAQAERNDGYGSATGDFAWSGGPRSSACTATRGGTRLRSTAWQPACLFVRVPSCRSKLSQPQSLLHVGHDDVELCVANPLICTLCLPTQLHDLHLSLLHPAQRNDTAPSYAGVSGAGLQATYYSSASFSGALASLPAALPDLAAFPAAV